MVCTLMACSAVLFKTCSWPSAHPNELCPCPPTALNWKCIMQPGPGICQQRIGAVRGKGGGGGRAESAGTVSFGSVSWDSRSIPSTLSCFQH